MRALNSKQLVSIEDQPLKTVQGAKERYSLGRNTLMRVAEEAGAVVRLGRRTVRIDCQKMDAYLLR